MTELAIVNARVRTLDDARPLAEAVATRDGEIVAVGSNEEVRASCTGRAELVDLRGAALVPGLIDAHVHPIHEAGRLELIDLTEAQTLDDVAAGYAAERAERGPAAILRAYNVAPSIFAPGGTRGDELERVAAGPAIASFPDGHTYLVTRHVLEQCGITGAETFDGAGHVAVDADGRPTGLLVESAVNLILRLLERPTGERLLELQRRVFRMMNEVGLTGAHCMVGTVGYQREAATHEERGDLTLRLSIPYWITPEQSDDELEELIAHRDHHGRLWDGGAVKFFLDGVDATGTAWLSEPDADGDGLVPQWEPARFRDTVARFARAGFRCATHAVGDRAIEHCLDSYGVARPLRGQHRVEHCDLVPDRLLPRFAAEGVTASLQPFHLAFSRPVGASESDRRLGGRMAWSCRTRDLVEAGAIVALGSDWPVVSVDPRLGMAWTRLRREPGRPDEEPRTPDQSLDGLQTLHGYTTYAAAAVGDPRAGRIRVGAHADLTAFAEDPVETPADDLSALPVVLTVVDGAIVHRSEP